MRESIPVMLELSDIREILDLPEDHRAGFRDDLHIFETPTDRQRFAEPYIEALARSPEWRDWRNLTSYEERAARFAGTTAAKNAIAMAELSHELILQEYLVLPTKRSLMRTSVSELLQVPYKEVPGVCARGGVELQTGYKRAAVPLEQFRTLYAWRRPQSLKNDRPITAATVLSYEG